MNGEDNNQHIPSRLVLVGLYLLIALATLLPRVLDLGGFVIEDEARYWLDRSYRFLDALDRRDYGATAISTHPGVTTMWSGTIGIMLKRTLLEWGWLETAPFSTTLALMRLPAVLVHTLGVLVGYALLRRMLPLGVATLAALLWAADPLTVSMSRVLHVDGLMTTFAILSVLAACFYWHHGRHPAILVLSAACGGLSLMSKSPGLVTIPMVGMIALWSALVPPEDEPRPQSLLRALAAPLPALLAWGGVFALTIVIAWPAVWADPMRVYELLRIGVEVEGGSPHVQGNYFLGREDDEPGVLFYPVAIAMRLTPWAMLGLFALPLVWQRAPISRATRRDLAVLVMYALLVTLALSLFPKKLNRYIVPIFPALNILAAVGLVWGAQQVAQVLGARWQVAQMQAVLQRIGWAIAGVVGVLALLNAAWWHPYNIAYFNQALGGAPAGAHAFLIGSGEGLEQVADWLNQQPDITGVVVASTMTPALQPYLRHGAQSLSRRGDDFPASTGYAVVYVRNVWGGAVPPFDRYYQQVPPLYTVNIHGVEYAWVYQVPPPVSNPITATFGSDIRLRGYEVDTTALRSTGTLSLTVQWQALAPLEQDYLMFAHVLDSSGQTIAQIDVPPAGPAAPTGAWQPGRFYTWVHPVPLPADLPPGDYWLSLGLYHPDTFARLPLRRATAAPPGAPDGGPHALLLPLPVGEP